MPHIAITPTRDELKQAMSDSGALLAVWTDAWDSFDRSEWWWTCCDAADYTLGSVKSARGRRSIGKGQRECSVRRVEPDAFAHLAFRIYSEAVASYGGKPPAEAEYAGAIGRMAAYSGTEFWGAFRGDGLAAFAVCQIVDGAVTLGSTKSDPSLNRYNPNAALFYSLTKYYLSQGMSYVTNGSRTLWHPTSINDFLVTLGFRRVYCRVNVELAPLVRLTERTRLLSLAKNLPLESILGSRWRRLQGLERLIAISRSFSGS